MIFTSYALAYSIVVRLSGWKKVVYIRRFENIKETRGLT